MTWREEQIGDARLILGDCLEIMPTLGKVDAVVTDPPYLMGSASARSPLGRPKNRTGDWINAAVFYTQWISQSWKLIKDDGSLWACGNWRGLPTFQIALDRIGAPLSSVVVWDKQWIGVGPLNGLRQSYELVFHSAKGAGITNRSIPDVWAVPWSSRRPSGHESEKPIGLMERCIESGCSQIILDPFMGSGTTGVACAKLGRKFIGIEFVPEYFDIACERIQRAYAQPDMFIEPPSPKADSEKTGLLPFAAE